MVLRADAKKKSTARRIGWRGRLLALAIGFIVALGTAEGAVRLLGASGPSLLVKDDVVGQRYRPGEFPGTFVPEAGRRIDLRFNRLGYRGADPRTPKPEGLRRVAVLGDSFIAAIAVDESESFVCQLETLLDRSTAARDWEVLNFGVSGAGTAQTLLAWRSIVRPLDPDVVLLCFYNGNDLADNHPQLSSGHRPYFALDESGELVMLPFSAGRATLSRLLAEHSRLYVFQKHALRVARDRLRESAKILPPGFEIFNVATPPPVDEAWRVTERLIETLAEEVAAAGARFVIVQIPSHEQLVDDRWRKLLATVGPRAGDFDRDHPERRLGRLCQEAGIEHVPLVEEMRRRALRETIYFQGDGHWNEVGNRLAADIVFAYLRSHRLARQ
jgi:lysophospholipase L1-like esterase